MMCNSFEGLRFYRPVADRVAKRSIPEPNSGCLLWMGSVTSDGYGSMGVGHKTALAHRAHWIALNGPIPEGLHVLHRCDTPCCVNIDHLFLGTNAENVADKLRKGRHQSVVGEANPRAKLSEQDVRDIRNDKRSARAIARAYGMSLPSIRMLQKRETWSHVR